MTLAEYPLHDSQRGWFGRTLYFEMQRNPDILLFTGDLGYSMFDLHQRDFPGRFFNTGAAEQCLLGAGVGAALMGKIPILYSITPFLLYRPFEWIRNYLNHEQIPVLLIGSGLDNDYAHDGITHNASDAKDVLKLFPNIGTYFPEHNPEVRWFLEEMIEAKRPAFMALRR